MNLLMLIYTFMNKAMFEVTIVSARNTECSHPYCDWRNEVIFLCLMNPFGIPL